MVLPLDVLDDNLESRMRLILKDGRRLRGEFIGYDQYMNVVLEDTEEETDESTRRLGTVVLRGNNVVSMVLDE
ncbi:RNA-binding protein [Thermoplasmatales archaeon SW_10_69_26]|nr:MAG: RNA-binding protein [Thermoplasmatales archaeon SW_10_69_26]